MMSCRDICRHADECDKDTEEGCDDFYCNCSRVKFVGSSKHGNYYKCLVCGEEGEG